MPIRHRQRSEIGCCRFRDTPLGERSGSECLVPWLDFHSQNAVVVRLNGGIYLIDMAIRRLAVRTRSLERCDLLHAFDKHATAVPWRNQPIALSEHRWERTGFGRC